MAAAGNGADHDRAGGGCEIRDFRYPESAIAITHVERNDQDAVAAARPFEQMGGQTSPSVPGAWCGMVTGRAGTTVEIACL